jgi:ABC-2 type transport system permease protein
MRREGSPWTGLGAVFLKEFADHLSSMRMRVLEWLMLIAGLGAVYIAVQDVKAMTQQDPFLFLRLFTYSPESSIAPAFVAVIGFLVPLIAIGLGFDAVNSEFNRRTLSRVLSQPIYRDALLLGKFLAGLATIAVSLTAVWLLVLGAGLVVLGVPPGGEEVARALGFLAVTIAYAGVWLAVAILCSVVFRSAATSVLCALGLWLFLTVLWQYLLTPIVRLLVSVGWIQVVDVQSLLDLVHYQEMLARVSPATLFVEAIEGLLNPATRTLSQLYMAIPQAVPGAPLPFAQSLLLVWPQVTGLVAAAILVFALTYVLFQRQEIRA